MNTRTPWTDQENAAIVALYFRMLDGVHRVGVKLAKAPLIRIAQGNTIGSEHLLSDTADFAGLLNARSKGSIEAKLMNCTAAHYDLDLTATTMDNYGYRALSNYKKTLKVALRPQVEARRYTGEGYENDGTVIPSA